MDPAGVIHSYGMPNVAATATTTSSHSSASPSASASAASPMSADVDHGFQSRLPAQAQDQAQAIRRRSAVACRRCRRMRSKCIHVKGNPPCKSCHEAGIPAEHCIFPVRGQPDLDREYRHPRTRQDKSSKNRTPAKRPTPGADDSSGAPHRRPTDDWHGLPPLEDLIHGVELFTRYYLQLGFIPKDHYVKRLRNDLRSTSLFLLVSILSISARLSPAFRLRYGGGAQAALHFMERASAVAAKEVHQEPTLERCQAFLLLSIAQQGNAERNKSYINLGIAVRMAMLMQLHLEETYHLSDPTPDHIIRAESARRTIWMLHRQDNLHSGTLSPASLSVGGITSLLPCNEEDFANGRVPRSRAALEGTAPAIDNPKTIRDPNRSLFATLMQVHSWWGLVGRRAVRFHKSPKPWDPVSEFSQTARMLREWEQDLPHEHIWSTFLFKGYRAENQELAYLCVTAMTRLSNIVLRRPYLRDIIRPDKKDTTKHAFFRSMSDEIFANVWALYEQVDTLFTNRTPDECVGAQTPAFCVYSCGLFSTYLCKYPDICRDKSIARNGPMMVQRCIGILKQYREVWPLAIRWITALEKLSLDFVTIALAHEATSPDDAKDTISRAFRQLPPLYPNFPAAASLPPPPPHPNLPEPNVLPRPGTQPELPPASSIGSPLYQRNMPKSRSGSVVDGLHHLPSPPQQQAHAQFLSRQSSHAWPHSSYPPPAHHHHQQQQQSNPHPHPQPQQHGASPSMAQNFYTSPQPVSQGGRFESEGVGILVESYGSPPSGASLGQLVPEPGPASDGFEEELQNFMDGSPSAMWISTATPWLNTSQ